MCGEGGSEVDVRRRVEAEANAWRLESGGGCDGRQAHVKKVEGQSAQCVRNAGKPVWD